jgi:excisionase family DNA binding protein
VFITMVKCNPQQSKGERAVETRTKEVLNAEEAAEFLGVNPYTVRQKARSGEMPGRKVGKEWRFSRQALLEWLKGSDRHKVHA